MQSREHINPSALRRAPTPSRAAAKQRVGFTISSPSEGDDDEWVSSESGAATPSNDSDIEESTTPIDTRKLQLPQASALTNGFSRDEQPTPRPGPPSLPRVETVRLSESSLNNSTLVSRDYAPQPQPSRSAQYHQVNHDAPRILEPPQHQAALPELLPVTQSPPTVPIVTKARSETHSPPRRSPDTVKTRSMTRPPSTHSISSSSTHPLRPHPLIRAHSVGHGVLRPAKPAPLAPLTTVSTEPVPGEMSATSPSSLRAASPTLTTYTNGISPVLSQPSPSGSSEASRQLRRTSVSSRSSVATLPATMHASPSMAQLGRAANHDRQRTLSSSSTFGGALSNLSNLNLQMRSTPSPPKTPVQHVVAFFPPNEQVVQSESVHTLLPPPYLSAHLTMLAYRNPLAESYDRVLRAKQGR